MTSSLSSKFSRAARVVVALLLVAGLSCSDTYEIRNRDGRVADAGRDAGRDAGPDAVVVDSGIDTGRDA